MAGPWYVKVNSNATTSSAFVIPVTGKSTVMLVPSQTAGPILMQFAINSGTAPWWALYQPGAATAFQTTVYSGAGPAAVVLPPLPTQFAQLTVPALASSVRTFTLIALNH